MEPSREISDSTLTALYEGNGLFARIIDLPAEEAVRNGFTLHDGASREAADFYVEALDDLAWEETLSTAVKWTRLYGGALAVMLIDDGRGLENPLDLGHIRAVDGIRVYGCPSVHPVLKGGEPEYFHVSSPTGSFVAHASRCLVFRGDPASERTEIPRYEQWGIPEAVRIIQAVQRAEVTHHSAVRLLNSSVQTVYKMRGLADVAAAEGGEAAILNRLEILDMARGLLGTVTIDAENESYEVFRTFPKGVSEILLSAKLYLCAVSHIPYAVLWGDGIAENSWSKADDTSMGNYYDYVAGIQSRLLKGQLDHLLSILSHCYHGAEAGRPAVKFCPLWSIDEREAVEASYKRAEAQRNRALIVQKYMDMGAIPRSRADIRKFVQRLKRQ